MRSIRNSQPRLRRADCLGFTLIELMVVIGIIALLVGLVSVVLVKGRNTATRSLAQRQVTSIASAVDQFHTDFGYHPPLLINPFPVGSPPPVNGKEQMIVPEAVYRSDPPAYQLALREARWHSSVSLTAYLAGVGDINLDEIDIYDNRTTDVVEPNYDDGADGPGIRHPGIDQSWGGAANRALQQKPSEGGRVVPPQGRVFGPYIDIGSLGDLLVKRESDGMYEILDPFGNRVRYYRNWPVLDPDAQKHIVMVPAELRSAESFTAQILVGDEDIEAATQIDRDVLTAPYVVLGAGMRADRQVRDQNNNFVDLEPFGDVIPDGEQPYRIQIDSPTQKLDDATFMDSGMDADSGLRNLFLKYLETNVKGGV